jgi:membrane protein
MTIDRTLNAIFRVARPQKIWRRIVVYWVVVSLGPLLLGAGIAGVTYVVSASLGAVNEPLWVRSALFRSLPMLLLAGLLTFLYSAVPNRPIQLRHALAGGVFATLAFAVLQKLFGLYISKFPTYTLIYGAFATVPIFLLWLYLSWTVVLLGALITAVLPEFLWGRRSVPRRPGREVVCALLALRALGQAQRKGESRSGLQLAAASRQTESEVELMLERMRDAGWVAQTDEGDWMLARRLEDLSLADAFERFAFSPLCAAGTGTADDIDLRARLLEAHGNAAEKLAVPLSRLFD